MQLLGANHTISSLVQGVVVPNVGPQGFCFLFFLSYFPAYTFLSQNMKWNNLKMISSNTFDLTYLYLSLALEVLTPQPVDKLSSRPSYTIKATEIVGTWISTGLAEYNANHSQNWKSRITQVIS
jgi:exportin-2 (importin alpha re-exporter)